MGNLKVLDRWERRRGKASRLVDEVGERLEAGRAGGTKGSGEVVHHCEEGIACFG
jgi:hypothetical protein